MICKHVFEYCIRIEFQSRCTIHFHIALWAILGMPKDRLIGRSGKIASELVKFLELFNSSVDVQVGSGYLNYINGYVTKPQNQMDFNHAQYTSMRTSPSCDVSFDEWLWTSALLQDYERLRRFLAQG